MSHLVRHWQLVVRHVTRQLVGQVVELVSHLVRHWQLVVRHVTRQLVGQMGAFSARRYFPISSKCTARTLSGSGSLVRNTASTPVIVKLWVSTLLMNLELLTVRVWVPCLRFRYLRVRRWGFGRIVFGGCSATYRSPGPGGWVNFTGMCHEITQTPVPIQIQISRPTPEL